MEKHKKYSFEIKKKVVELYFEGQSAITIAKENNISSDRRVLAWSKMVREANSFEVLRDTQRKKKTTR